MAERGQPVELVTPTVARDLRPLWAQIVPRREIDTVRALQTIIDRLNARLDRLETAAKEHGWTLE